MSRQATTAELRAKMAKIQKQIEERETAERLKIGEEMQKRTGLETWDEIVKTLDGAGTNGGS